MKHKQTRTLKLKHETVRHLDKLDLERARGGCDTTSWTTEKPTQPIGG